MTAFARTVENGPEQIRRIDRAEAKRIGGEFFDRHPELFRKLAQ